MKVEDRPGGVKGANPASEEANEEPDKDLGHCELELEAAEEELHSFLYSVSHDFGG